MDQGVDTGGIISQEAIPIDQEDTAGSLLEKLSHLGAELLIETLPPYLSSKLHPQAQNEADATYAPMLKKDNGLLDFTRTADELARQVHAFNPWPGAFLEWNGQPLKVHQAHAETGNTSLQQRLVIQGRPAVGTAVGLLVLDKVQPSGKKPMSGEAFLMGARTWTS
jgi:methionyl-tRNA formyltransferase